MIQQDLYDLVVIGGGINGAGIAADAAGRGLSVLLCEQNDLACATSSASSKLIHGGLRYLEHYEFRLVREALREREILLHKAPHIIHPLRFVMPHHQALRPAWIIRLGLFLYDHLAARQILPRSHSINLKHHEAGKALHGFSKGFIYSDCWVDDARLVVLNAMAAKQHGAVILTRTQCVDAVRQNDRWHVRLKNILDGEQMIVSAKALVNAAGPWVEDVIKNKVHLTSKNHIRLVKGSHIIVPKLYQHHNAYLLQNTDKRVVFVIPFLEQYCLIGTTDILYQNDPAHTCITPEETRYLCDAVNHYFANKISPADVIWSYAGVRALHQDDANNPSAITRDYTLEIDTHDGKAPMLSVFGGKITTYRKLAEHALAKLRPFFPNCSHDWTAKAVLPGGDIPHANFELFAQQFAKKFPWLPESLAYRYAKNYGTLASTVLDNATCLDDLGTHFGAGLYQLEVEYLINNEWAKTAEDILWRRTKLGLVFTAKNINQLNAFLLATA